MIRRKQASKIPPIGKNSLSQATMLYAAVRPEPEHLDNQQAV